MYFVECCCILNARTRSVKYEVKQMLSLISFVGLVSILAPLQSLRMVNICDFLKIVNLDRQQFCCSLIH